MKSKNNGPCPRCGVTYSIYEENGFCWWCSRGIAIKSIKTCIICKDKYREIKSSKMCGKCLRKWRKDNKNKTKKFSQLSRIKSHKSEIDLLYKTKMNAAIRRGIEWSLTIGGYSGIVYLACIYCGSKPSNGGQGIQKKYSGIDRINSNLGYVKGNCVPCCKLCNAMKRALSLSEFYTHIRKISNFGSNNDSLCVN